MTAGFRSACEKVVDGSGVSILFGRLALCRRFWTESALLNRRISARPDPNERELRTGGTILQCFGWSVLAEESAQFAALDSPREPQSTSPAARPEVGAGIGSRRWYWESPPIAAKTRCDDFRKLSFSKALLRGR
jgi:hypothetical protein